MRILFLTLQALAAEESSSIRNMNLIEGLLANGHIVDAMSPGASPKINNKKFQFICIDDSRSVSSADSISNRRLIKKLKRIYKKFAFLDSTKFLIKKVNRFIIPNYNYDIVISSSDPVSSHIAMRKVLDRGLRASKWIQYWGDPYAADINRSNIYPVWINRIFERELLKGADKIVYVSPFTLKIEKVFFPMYSNRMSVIPISYSPISNKQPKTDNLELNEKVVTFGYFGAYRSTVRNILPLYKAFSNLEKTCKLFLIGNSDLKLKNMANIEIKERMSREELESYERKCEVIICLLNKSGTQIPGKIFHGAGTSKPIIIIKDGEYAEQIEGFLGKYNRFIFCENNEKSIRETVENLLKQESMQVEPCKELASPCIAKHFVDFTEM